MRLKKNMKIFLVIVSIIAVIFLFTLLSFGKITGFVTRTSNENTIHIGAILALSGDGSAWGSSSQKAIDMAIEEINSKGGISGKKVQIIYEDSQGMPSNAVSAYIKLRDLDKVDAIIGPNLQSEVSVIAPMAYEDKMPIITPSYAPLENRPDKKNPLMIWLDPDYESKKMAEYVYSKGVFKVAILGTQDSWEKQVSESFKERFEELGGEIVYISLPPSDISDVRTIVSKSISANPQAIFIGSYYQFINYAKALAEQGYAGYLYSIEVDEYLAQETKEIIRYMEFIGPQMYATSFRDKYYSKYQIKTNLPAGQAYDSAQILLSAIESSDSRTELIDFFHSITEYDGASGKIIFDDNRTIVSTQIYSITYGEISVK